MLNIQKRTCANCVHGSPVPVNCDILCYFKGIVSSNYCCSKHRYTPINLKSKRKCIQCEYFIQSAEGSKNIGYCKLFTVRTYDGNFKNACSKFSKRQEMKQEDDVRKKESSVV